MRTRWVLGFLAMQVERLPLGRYGDTDKAEMDRDSIEMGETWDQVNLPHEGDSNRIGVWKELKHPVSEYRCVQYLT